MKRNSLMSAFALLATAAAVIAIAASLAFSARASVGAGIGAGVGAKSVGAKDFSKYQFTPADTFMWKGIELKREDYSGRYDEAKVPENVITTEARALTVYFYSNGGDEMEYGTSEILQVYNDGAWYTLPYNLSRRSDPLLLPPSPPRAEYLSEATKTEHTVDLSVTGGLAPGKYRLIEKFYWPRLQTEFAYLAFFWVIEPGGKRPPESETSGPARVSDIVLRAVPFSAVQSVITDRDMNFFIFIENLSAKRYQALAASIERKSKDGWDFVRFEHANLGLISGGESRENQLFLSEPLTAGEYRLKVTMKAFDYASEERIKPERKFVVLAFDNIQLQWDPAQLRLSEYDESKMNADVTITITNPVLNKGNTNLEYIVAANNHHYSFGEPYEVDVLLDGKWYNVPLANRAFTAIGYSVAPDMPTADRTRSCDPLSSCARLPVGQYRVVKEFYRYDPRAQARFESPVRYSVKEYASAEFTVEELLEWAR